MSRIIGFDAQLIFDAIITGINIFILFFALSYFLFNPIQKVLKDRQDKIKNELENAKNKETEAIALKEEYEKKMNDARLEADEILSNAKKNAKTMSEQIILEAKTEANNIIARGNKEIEQERAKAVDELKDKVIEISTILATKIIKENVNTKNADKLFEETISEIGDSTWQN